MAFQRNNPVEGVLCPATSSDIPSIKFPQCEACRQNLCELCMRNHSDCKSWYKDVYADANMPSLAGASTPVPGLFDRHHVPQETAQVEWSEVDSVPTLCRVARFQPPVLSFSSTPSAARASTPDPSNDATLFCDACEMWINDPEQKPENNAAQREKPFCEVCQTYEHGPEQMIDHINGKRHKNNLVACSGECR